jgi:hypothetical protein
MGSSTGAALAAVVVLLAAAGWARAAAEEPPPPRLWPGPATEVAGTGSLGLLLVPEATNDRVMAFDPATGDLVRADYIPSTPGSLSSPINAILSASGDSILVSDNDLDVVQEFGLLGNYLGVFAPAGGPITTVLDAPTGITFRSNGHLLVAAASLAVGQDRVAEFDPAGNFTGTFIAAGSGGLDLPFDIFLRPRSDWLVSSTGSDAVLRYNLTTGAALGSLATVVGLPEQIALARNGNVLVANFSGSQAGIVEFTSAGSLVGIYTATTLSGYRGVYELPNLNLLVATAGGVFEISRADELVDTKLSGVNARYIEQVDVPSLRLEKTVGADPQTCATSDALNADYGAAATYCFKIINTGNVTLTRHTLVDNQLGTLLNNFAYNLTPGASAFLTHSAVLTITTVNTATWTASNPGPTHVVSATSYATATVPAPAISLVKTVGLDAHTCAATGTLTVTAATEVTYCYTVLNTGGVTLTRHTLYDDQLGTILSNFPYSLGLTSSAFLTQTAAITATTVNGAVWTAFNPGPVNATQSAAQARVVLLRRSYLPVIQR